MTLLGTTAVAGAATAAESSWTSVTTPAGNTLYDVEDTTAGVYAVGGDGAMYDRENARWSADATPTGENLKAVVLRGGESAVAVGAAGTVIER